MKQVKLTQRQTSTAIFEYLLKRGQSPVRKRGVKNVGGASVVTVRSAASQR